MGDDVTRDLAALLERRLSTVLNVPVTISDLHQLSGGASRETWAFDAHPQQQRTRRLILRRDPSAAVRASGSMAWEATAIRAAGNAGVAVPELVDHGTDDTNLDAPYLISTHLAGETIPRRLLRNAEFDGIRPTLARELGRTLARIHSVSPTTLPELPRPDPLNELVATYDELGEPLPPVELALRWLRSNQPDAREKTLVHGDFRNGNLIIDHTGLRAVLDWELAHVGDPLRDLGWLCVKAWRFGASAPVGGFGSRAELFDGYREVSGSAPDPEAVHWWEVFGTAWWAVGCRTQAQRHLDGTNGTVELAAIGRMVCEQEHDLLLALGIPLPEEAADCATQRNGAVSSDLHGRPSAAELVAAVSEFLRTDVLPATEGRLHFHARVAANVLATVERELELGAEQESRDRQRLASLGFPDRASFAAAIRSGDVDPDEHEVLAAVRNAVTDKLKVANPRYLSHPN